MSRSWVTVTSACIEQFPRRPPDGGGAQGARRGAVGPLLQNEPGQRVVTLATLCFDDKMAIELRFVESLRNVTTLSTRVEVNWSFQGTLDGCAVVREARGVGEAGQG